ncbi:hypothetical protein LEN26_005874 [Aphanomyces euteiches]|nr:hypothetical protein AeMF1_010981 [Aphanomyces euteiches]KAH9137216.1 hypothetical protein LEN26_005874 [Aphanomyces euteiches]
MSHAPHARLTENSPAKYGSFSTVEPPSWIFGQINTPTKALIEQDFCTSHEHVLPVGGDSVDAKKLVIRFNTEGVMEYLEMSRSDILKLEDVPADQGNELRAGVAARMQHATATRSRKRSIAGYMTHHGVNEIPLLHMRDLRKLDDTFHSTNAASITIRRQVILVHADPLRCVVMRDALIVFVPTGADTLIKIIRDKIAQCCAEEGEMDFEFRALEAIFHTLCKMLSGDCEKLVSNVSTVLTRLSGASVSSGELEVLTILKNKVHEFESQILDIRSVLMELLDNDQDMRLLYLTKLHDNPTPTTDIMGLDVEEAEGLIEAYLLDIHSMRTKVGLLQTRMANTENIVVLKLDSVRNALLSIDTIFGMIMLAMNVSMFVSSAFGMNLLSGYETEPYLFWVVLFFSTLFSFVMSYVGIQFFKAKGVILL